MQLVPRWKALGAASAAAMMLAASATAAEATESGYDEYVALGDSYTAGPLITPQVAGPPTTCLRSAANYPSFLAAYLKVRRFDDVSCSAADTTHMLLPQDTVSGAPSPLTTNLPQFDALRDSTDLVSLGIGGNDFGLFGDLIDECADLAVDDPEGSPCKDFFTVDGVDTKMRDAALIQDNVDAVVKGIAERSPSADIVVVGYLRILPQKGTCEDVPFATGDYAWGDEIERRLNLSLKRAATANGATYVNMYPSSKGHDACAGDDAWVNGAEIKPLRALNYHPFARGMEGIAQQSYTTLTGKDAPRSLPRAKLLNVPRLG